MDMNDQTRHLLEVPAYVFVPAVSDDDNNDEASNCSISLGSVASLDEMDLVFDGDKSSTRWAEESGQCALHSTSREEDPSISERRLPASQSRVHTKRRIRRIPTKSVKSSSTACQQVLSHMAAAAAASAPTLKRQGSNDLPPKAPRRRGSTTQASVRRALAA